MREIARIGFSDIGQVFNPQGNLQPMNAATDAGRCRCAGCRLAQRTLQTLRRGESVPDRASGFSARAPRRGRWSRDGSRNESCHDVTISARFTLDLPLAARHAAMTNFYNRWWQLNWQLMAHLARRPATSAHVSPRADGGAYEGPRPLKWLRRFAVYYWSGRVDLNHRPLGPEPSALVKDC
jgi:hypothetical protein